MKRMCSSRQGTRVVPLVVLLASLATVAQAQSTQPTPPGASWPEMITRLADAVRGKDVPTLLALLERGPIIRTFASEELVAPERLLGATTSSRVLSVHAYPKVPATLATDLAEDFRSADIPDTLRRDMLIPDAVSEREANETAARWLTHVLRPGPEMPVAVIILWRPEKHESINSNAQTRPVFVLVKGEMQHGQYVIRQLIYGDPLEKPK